MNKEYYGVRRVGDNEEAYIAHIGREKGWKMPNAKYIARLITSNGTYKYIYNQAQLAAAKGGQAMSRARRTAQNAAGGLRSLEKKYTNKRGALFTQVDNALGLSRSGAQVKKARAQRAKVNGTQNGLQKALKNAGSAVSKAAGRAGKALSDASGLTARKNLSKAIMTEYKVSRGISSKRGKYESYNPNDPLEKRRNSTKKRYKEKVIKARDKYNKSLLGRAERFGDSVRSIAESVGNSKPAKNLRVLQRRAGSAIDSTLSSAQKNVSRAASDARKATGKTLRKTSVGKKIDNQLGISATAQNKKKNAAYKKQQLEKIEKGKSKNYRIYESAKNDAMRARRLENKYGDGNISPDSYAARQATHAKSWLNLKRAKPKNEKYMRDWRKGKMQQERTASVRGTESDNAINGKPVTYKSKKARLQSWRRKRGIR